MMTKSCISEEHWRSLEKGIHEVINIVEDKPGHSLSSTNYMQCYTITFNMTSNINDAKNCMELYKLFGDSLSYYIKQIVLPELENNYGIYLLKEFCRRWSNYCRLWKLLYRFFGYLDRYFVPRSYLPTLKQKAWQLYYDSVYSVFRFTVRDALLVSIHRERKGKKIDRTILKNTIEIFIIIGNEKTDMYVEDFEEEYLKQTASFYAKTAAKHIEEDSCSDYTLKVEDYLRREEDRATSYLHSTTREKLMKVLRHELLARFGSQLLENENTGLNALLEQRKVEHIKRIFELYSQIDGGLDIIISIFEKHVTDNGLALVKQADEMNKQNAGNKGQGDPAQQAFIKNIFKLHDDATKIVSYCSCENCKFQKALRKAFVVCCNKSIDGVSMGEILACFADNVLKKDSGYDEGTIEDTLDKIVIILNYVDDKDLFAEFYRKKLARRLLYGRGNNNELEKYILSKFKEANGRYFVSKMEGMLTDLTLAKEKQILFQDYKDQILSETSMQPKMDMVVTVLTTGFWPTYQSSDIYLPAEMAHSVEIFNDYYDLTTTKRKLRWLFSMGTCTIIGYFDAREIKLLVTTHQGALLMLFNNSDKLSFEEIREQLNLPGDEIIKLLHSLSCGKYKILNKKPDTKTIKVKDVFEFNSQFTDKLRKIRIPLPCNDEKKKVIEEVEKDRRYTIDAAIVRIMKARKVLEYQNLVTACIEQLMHSFKPDVKLIKQRVEDLIQRDYLERDQDDPNLFKYLP